MADKNKVRFGLKNVHVCSITEDAGAITYGKPTAWKGAKSLTLDPEGDTNSNNGYSESIEMHSERTDEFTIAERKSVSEKKF